MTYASDLSDATTAVGAVIDAATSKTALQKLLIVIANNKGLIDGNTTSINTNTTSINTNTTDIAAIKTTNVNQDAILAGLELYKYSPATKLKPANPYENGSEITASSPSLDGSALISLPGAQTGWLYAGLTISTAAALPNATSGQAYSQQLVATGGVSGDTKVWILDSRTPLPSGLSLSSSGLISGTRTGAVASPTSGYIVTVTDNHGNAISKRFSLAVV